MARRFKVTQRDPMDAFMKRNGWVATRELAMTHPHAAPGNRMGYQTRWTKTIDGKLLTVIAKDGRRGAKGYVDGRWMYTCDAVDMAAVSVEAEVKP